MLQHTIWPFCISPVARVQKPACLAATSAHRPFGLFLGLSGFSTSMDVIKKNQTKHMDSGLHWGHGGRFTVARNSSGPVQVQAYRQMEWMCSGWGVGSPAYNWAPWLTSLKLRLCVWSMVCQSCSLTSRFGWGERRQLADESKCVFWLHALERIPELLRSRSRHHLCCFPLKKCQLPNGSYFQKVRRENPKSSSKRMGNRT